MVSHENKSPRVKEIIVAGTALGLSILAIILSRNIYLRVGAGGLDAKWWPTVLSSGAAILSAILLFSALFMPISQDEDCEPAQKDGWIRMLVVVALTALYVFAWSRFGYVAPTAAYLFVLLWTFSIRSWKTLILYPILTTAFIYLLFHTMLRVPL